MGGGKGAAPSNNQMVQFEMQQAAEARAKEERRKTRLDAGKREIEQLFGGKPIFGDPVKSTLDLTGVTDDPTVSGLKYGDVGKNTGLKWKTGGFDVPPEVLAAAPAHLQQAYSADPSIARQYGFNANIDLLDDLGNVVASGTDWNDLVTKTKGMEFMKPNRVGSEGGFGDQFYQDYQNKALGYYLPQLGEQMGELTKKSTFDLARAGLLRSTAANEVAANISKQSKVQEGMLRRKAENQTAELRNMINSQQAQAMSQLEAQEDPDVAATSAINMVNSAKLAQPDQPQLGDLFKPLVIGALGAANAYGSSDAFSRGLTAKGSTGGGAWKVAGG